MTRLLLPKSRIVWSLVPVMSHSCPVHEGEIAKSRQMARLRCVVKYLCFLQEGVRSGVFYTRSILDIEVHCIHNIWMKSKQFWLRYGAYKVLYFCHYFGTILHLYEKFWSAELVWRNRTPAYPYGAMIPNPPKFGGHQTSFFFSLPRSCFGALSRSSNRIYSDSERCITNRTSILVHLCHQLPREYTCFEMQLIWQEYW